MFRTKFKNKYKDKANNKISDKINNTVSELKKVNEGQGNKGENQERRKLPWQKSLKAILQVHGKVAADSAKAVGFATQAARRHTLEAGFRELWKLGYHLPTVQGFGNRHMIALGHAWEAQGLSSSTIQNRISIFRTFAEWTGKQGMVGDSRHYVKNPESVRREVVTRTDKTWSGQNQSLKQKLPSIEAKDPFVAIQLELQRAFGLRMKEASLLHPHMADNTHYLAVNWGTKGGRARVVPIQHDSQREVLARAKNLVSQNASMIPRSYNFKQWRNHYYFVCQGQGISRKDGITSHGLRHERLNEIYHEKTGYLSPIKSKTERNRSSFFSGRAADEVDKAARQEIAEVAGHSRAAIASSYIGS